MTYHGLLLINNALTLAISIGLLYAIKKSYELRLQSYFMILLLVTFYFFLIDFTVGIIKFIFLIQSLEDIIMIESFHIVALAILITGYTLSFSDAAREIRKNRNEQ